LLPSKDAVDTNGGEWNIGSGTKRWHTAYIKNLGSASYPVNNAYITNLTLGNSGLSSSGPFIITSTAGYTGAAEKPDTTTYNNNAL
jgi:archaellum component FlaG (FlaF/FlaG flagellin family)